MTGQVLSQVGVPAAVAHCIRPMIQPVRLTLIGVTIRAVCVRAWHAQVCE